MISPLPLTILLSAAYGASPVPETPKIFSEDLATVDKALKDGADIEQRNFFGMTPLQMAAFRSRLDAVKLLVSRGAQPSTKTRAGATPADLAEKAGHRRAAGRLREPAGKTR